MKSVTVIGAGAAGIMAAHWAAKGGASVTLFEGSTTPGKKILVSGGGRCNVLPQQSSVKDFHTQGSKNLVKRWFKSWSLADIRQFFEDDLSIPLIDEEDGKVFPKSGKSREIRDALLHSAIEAGVILKQSFRVEDLSPYLEQGPVILATGGRSVPKTGSDGKGYGLCKDLGHSLVTPYPALVPLWNEEADFQSLSGLSLPVQWQARTPQGKILDQGRRNLLFTHKGFSGPAILDASHWVTREQAELFVNWGEKNAAEWEKILLYESGKITPLLQEHLPRRLAKTLLRRVAIPPDLNLAQLDKVRRKELIRKITECPLNITADAGWNAAEVTGGGIPLSEVNPASFESRCQPNLFLCGEILDCTGRLGGYNFLWAWVSARLAGTASAQEQKED